MAIWLLVVAGFLAPMDGYRAGRLGSASDAVLGVALLVLVGRWLAGGGRHPMSPYSRTVLFGCLFFGAGILGTFASVDPGASLLNAGRFLWAVAALPLSFALVEPSRRGVRTLAWAYVAGASVSAAVALLRPSPVSGRGQGLALAYNGLGLTSALAFAVLLGLALSASRSRPATAVAAVLAVCLVGGVMVSGSRAALAGAVGAVLTFLAATGRTRHVVLAGAVAALLTAALATGAWVPSDSSAAGRLVGRDDFVAESDEGRRELRDEVVARIGRNPLTGSGFAAATQAHSVPIQVADVGGVLGVVAFAGLLWSVLRRLVPRRADPLMAGFLAAVAAYLVAGLASNPLWDRWIWFPISTALAHSLHVPRRRRDRARPVS